MPIVLLSIVFIIICVAVGFCCYRFGYDNKFQEVSYNNEVELNKHKAICDSIQEKEKELSDLKEEYEEKKSIIDDANERAKKEYLTRSTLLAERYSKQEKELQEQFNEMQSELAEKTQEQLESSKEQVENVLAELEKLSQTKASAIKALQQEELIKNEQDSYRLNIDKNDLNDVEVLESVRPRLNKPRILSMLIWQTYFRQLARSKFALILGDEIVCGIYKITNTFDQKVYIGQAKDIKKRWFDHVKCGLGIDTPANNKLYQAMLKDGVENFTFELLEECEEKDLNEKEQYFIEFFNSIDYGYNGRKQK